MRVLVEPVDVEPFVRITRFVGGDEEGADYESQRLSLDGIAVDEQVRERSTWVEFQQHASFPEASTTITDDLIEIPAGRFECLRYTVTDDDSADTFWFARSLPGMPIKVSSHSGGVDTTVMTMLGNAFEGGIT